MGDEVELWRDIKESTKQYKQDNWFYKMSGKVADRINAIEDENERLKEIEYYEKCIDDIRILGNRSNYRSKCCNSITLLNIIPPIRNGLYETRYLICMECMSPCEVNKIN